MSDRSERVGDYLRATKVGRRTTVEGADLSPRLLMLRAWQAERLARTYSDMLDDPRYAPACRFFLTDVYAARDFSQRDHDILRMYESTRRVLPAALARTLELVVELNALTTALDARLLAALVDDVGVTESLDAEQYAEGYRRCDNYDDRARQIDLVVEVGREIDELVRRPAVGLALKLARVPARLSGWHEMQAFFERGFDAFRRIDGAGPFLDTVAAREREILDAIYAEPTRGADR
jgi:hypothetical protein